MQFKNKLLVSAVAATVLSLSACGGGGGGGSGGSTSSSNTLTVTPSLGKFSAGTVVRIKRPDGTLIQTGSLNANGSVSMDVGTYAGPVLVEVQGAPGVTYYDEGTNAQVNFGAGEVLRAVLPSPMPTVGVSSLTSAAVAKLEAAGSLSNITADSIKTANLQIATAFGLPDVLAVPVAVSGTGAQLDVGTDSGKYALVLAALAKSATGGKNAVDVAKAIAADMKDGKLDGQNGSTPVPDAPTATNIAASYQSAATLFANSASQTAVQNTPLVLKTDVTTVAAVSNQSDVSLAKAMFAELRTTFRSFSNGSKTGFLDTQATKAADEIKTVVGPDVTKLTARATALSKDITLFYNLKNPSPANNSYGFIPGVSDIDGTTPAWVRIDGTMQSNWDGFANIRKCYTDAATALNTKLVCVHASADAWDHVTGGKHTFRYIQFEITSNTSNSYSYTATRINKTATSISGGVPVWTNDPGTVVSSTTGTVTEVLSGTTTTQFVLNGALPSSNSGSGPDTLKLNFARANVSSNTYRYTYDGSIATSNISDATKLAKVALETGSFVDIDEADIVNPKPVQAKFIGSFQVANTKLVGTLDLGSFVNDRFSRVMNVPSAISFLGTVTDVSASGAGQYLTGKLELTVAGYPSYNSYLPDSELNFVKPTLTFTGTIKATDRPEMRAQLSVVRTSYLSSTANISYSYGTKSITGSGTGTSDGSAPSTGSVFNQDGITFNASTGKLTKNGSNLATIAGNLVNYVDGTSESLQ